MSLWAVLLTGLLAGGASCAAVQGGLLAGVVARRRPDPVPSRRGARPPATAPRPMDDAIPVAGFLTGKLISHVALGAALGSLGAAVELGFRTRALLQIAAGAVMVLLAADLLGLKAVRRVVPRPPAAWGPLLSSIWRPLQGATQASAAATPSVTDGNGTQRIAITVRPRSYSPSHLSARPGVPTELVLHSDRATGCTSAVVFPSLGIERMLPVDGDTLIPVGTLRPGRHQFTCAMGMYGGTIEVTP